MVTNKVEEAGPANNDARESVRRQRPRSRSRSIGVHPLAPWNKHSVRNSELPRLGRYYVPQVALGEASEPGDAAWHRDLREGRFRPVYDMATLRPKLAAGALR